MRFLFILFLLPLFSFGQKVYNLLPKTNPPFIENAIQKYTLVYSNIFNIKSDSIISKPIRIVCIGSVLKNDKPLYILNGMKVDETVVYNLNPKDIESIDILTEASAAIYGSQSKYGVVIITTKEFPKKIKKRKKEKSS